MTRRDFMKSAALAIAAFSAARPVLALAARMPGAVAVLEPMHPPPPHWRLGWIRQREAIRDKYGYEAAWISRVHGIELTRQRYFIVPPYKESEEAARDVGQAISLETIRRLPDYPERHVGGVLHSCGDIWLKGPLDTRIGHPLCEITETWRCYSPLGGGRA